MELENENDNGVKTVRLFRDMITGLGKPELFYKLLQI
jgi:hypothetical protein